MEKIALLPGGFKPPHAGHYNMAKWLILNTDADTVIVKVGVKIRDGINREVALKLWDLYRSTDPDPISKKIAILASNSNSPVQDVYDFVEKEAPKGSKIYLGMGEKDVNDKRFNNIGKFAEPKEINFEIKLVPPQTGGISGTEMRNFVKIKDKDNFLKYIPDHLSKSNKDKAWGIVTGLEEDLYNPEDKVLDYMRGSEWKAGMPDGPKDDKTSPVIKYQRGGMYNAATGQGGAGTMYENKYYLNDSNIQGQGAFAQENYPEGTVIDKLHDILGQGQYNFYELGKMYNHSETPNCKNIMKDNTRYLVTIQPIRQGEELTADYRLQPDLEQPEHFLNELEKSDLKSIDTFADKQLNPIDVDLTSSHFFDRLNDPRNDKEISNAELIGFFKRLARKKKELFNFLTKYKEIVASDIRTNINIPFLKQADKIIAKTILRKKDFQTSNPQLTLEKETINECWKGYVKKGMKKKGNKMVPNCVPQNEEVKYGASDLISQYKDKIQSDYGHQQYRDLQLMISQQKDEEVNKWLKTKGYMNEINIFSKDWWKEQLTEIITETKANTHLTHLEELILTQGQDGYNQAKNFLYELIKNLKGQDNSIKNVSVKWDGAPAIFTGINPDNNQFFVGTKSVFNKEPKINYTPQDIDTNHGHAPGLASKLKLALQYLPSVGINGILQGDFMFDNNDVETENIDDVPHYTFKPNTIRYAVEANSKLGKQIIAAKIGIIFHTTYNDLSGGGASFGADIKGLNNSTNVWFDDAYFKDDTGILLSDQEEKFILEKINEADSINIDYTNLPLKALNTYLNSEIRQGEFISDPYKSFEKFKNWYQRAVDKSIEKVKRPESKEKKRQAGELKIKEFESQKENIINIFNVSKLLSQAKSIFITKYDKAVATKHFIDNEDGTLSVTKAEGFVAVDHTENGIKLVDRLEFSKNNFNAGKPGAKK